MSAFYVSHRLLCGHTHTVQVTWGLTRRKFHHQYNGFPLGHTCNVGKTETSQAITDLWVPVFVSLAFEDLSAPYSQVA